MSQLLQRGIAAVVLVILAGSPVLGNVCAVLCAPADRSAAHGGSSDHAACQESGPASDASLTGSSIHDCGRHDLAHADGMLGLAPTRADSSVRLDMVTSCSSITAFGCSVTALRPSADRPPVVPSAPPRIPLVLRI